MVVAARFDDVGANPALCMRCSLMNAYTFRTDSDKCEMSNDDRGHE